MNIIKKYNERIIELIWLILGFVVIFWTTRNCSFIRTLDGDNAPQTYALYSFAAKALINGELPKWNSFLWGGISNVGSTITQAFYPINWILGIIRYDWDLGYVSYALITDNIILHIFIYFCGLFFLQKQLKVRDSFARFCICILGIFSFSFCKYFYFASWYSYIDVISWYPFIILTSIKLVNCSKRKDELIYTIVLGVLLGLEALLGIGPTMIYIAFSIVLLFLIEGIYRKRVLKCFSMIFNAGIIGIVIALPVLLCVVTFTNRCARYIDDFADFIYGNEGLPFDNFIGHAASLNDLVGMVSFNPSYTWMSMAGLLLLFAILSCFIKTNNNSIKLWAKAGFLYSTMYCIAFFVVDFVYYIPFLNTMREPFMYGMIMNVYATILAAMFVAEDKLTCSGLIINGRRLCIKKESILDCINNNAMLLTTVSLIILYNLLPKNISRISVVTILAFVIYIISIILDSYIMKVIALAISVVSYLIASYPMLNGGLFNSIIAENQIQAIIDYDKVYLEELINDEKGVRYMDFDDSCLPSNIGSVIGIMDMKGYFNPTTELGAKANLGIFLNKRSELHNIKYVFLNDNDDVSFIEWFEAAYMDSFDFKEYKELFNSYSSVDEARVRVYESNVAGEVGWFVYDYDFYSQKEETEYIIEWINDSSTDLKKKIMVNRDVDFNDNDLKEINDRGSYSVDLLEYANNLRKYKVDTSEYGILLLTEMYDPGWRVYINGVEKELLNVDYTNLGVVVPKGSHEVVLKYSPKEMNTGVCVQFVMIFGLIVFLVIKRLANKGLNDEDTI